MKTEKVVAPTSGRMSAKDMVEFKIKRLRSEADNLEILLEVLPDLTPEQDSAIWNVFTNISR